MLLSKTDYILYLECPSNLWVKKYHPIEYAKFKISEFEKTLKGEGDDVELLARKIFFDGYIVEGRGEEAQKLTQKFIVNKTPVIFQAVFQTDKYLAATDVLVWNNSVQKYDLYEIKMSSFGHVNNFNNKEKTERINKKKEIQYENDLAFQINVLKISGLKIYKKYLIRLNKNYIKNGELEFQSGKLFIIQDKTEIIDAIESVVNIKMKDAHQFLVNNQKLPSPCSCYSTKGRSSHCRAFSYINPKVPEYSVHDLNRIGNNKKYLAELINEDILQVFDVPVDDRLKLKKPKEIEIISKSRILNQVLVAKSQKPLIDIKSIKAELSRLVFPLYFLDYETYPATIPLYDGYHPYQQVVFQYSLHILKDRNAELIHCEKIILEGEPSERIVKSLRKNIGDIGTIIVWYKNFENSRNLELSIFVPQYSDFLNNIISRTYDLMDIIDNQYYVHPNFRGRSSIKQVLPVLVPTISYNSLVVKSGSDIIKIYRQILKKELIGKALGEKKKEMLEYCKLDTYALYLIWRFFNNLTLDKN